MARRYGIDTSILVRLLTRDPEKDFEYCTTKLSGLVAPLTGRSAVEALSATRGAGLLDRLIANDYSRAKMDTLTLDRRMASLPTVRRL